MFNRNRFTTLFWLEKCVADDPKHVGVKKKHMVTTARALPIHGNHNLDSQGVKAGPRSEHWRNSSFIQVPWQKARKDYIHSHIEEKTKTNSDSYELASPANADIFHIFSPSHRWYRKQKIEENKNKTIRCFLFFLDSLVS